MNQDKAINTSKQKEDRETSTVNVPVYHTDGNEQFINPENTMISSFKAVSYNKPEAAFVVSYLIIIKLLMFTLR